MNYTNKPSPMECDDHEMVKNLMECENCEEIFSSIWVCESCTRQLCFECDLKSHGKRKRDHQRKQIKDAKEDKRCKEKLESFRHIMLGNGAERIESAQFTVCSDRTFSLDILRAAFKSCNEHGNKKSLVQLLVAEIRDACRSKEDFDKVLCESSNLESIDNATINDFIICLLDSCNQRWQQQNIVECLMLFDYPITLGHVNCSMKPNEVMPRQAHMAYGLHLGELYHLIHSRHLEDEHQPQRINILSIGTQDTRCKSQFLNEIWLTKFEKRVENRGLHHKMLIELQVGNNDNKRQHNIIDVHGHLKDDEVLHQLCNAADCVILHCLVRDFDFAREKVNEELTNMLNSINGEKKHLTVIMVVQGTSTESWIDVEQQIRKAINYHWAINVNFFHLKDQWRDEQSLMQYHKQINEILKPIAPCTKPLHILYDTLSTLDQINGKKILKNSMPHFLENFRNKTKKVFSYSESSPLKWFPLHSNSVRLADLDNEQYEAANKGRHDAIRLEQQNIKEQRHQKISIPVMFFRDEVINKNDLDDAGSAFEVFQQELNAKFLPAVELKRKELKYLKDEFSKGSSQELKIKVQKATDEVVSFDIAIIHFIRELIERGKENIDDDANSAAIIASQNELRMGRSIEIVNGDSLTISTDFLQKVFQPIIDEISNKEIKSQATTRSKNTSFKGIHTLLEALTNGSRTDLLNKDTKQNFEFSSITVIGVESSGKSTLWNQLWNTNFPVAHGKCSRGLWSSLVQVKNGPALLVNDTEGILSPLTNKPRFDQKLMLLAFALSNIVVINVRGEGDSVLSDLIKLVIYAARKLHIFHRPQIVFVHRDVTGAKEYEQGNFKNILLEQLNTAFDAMIENDNEIKLEDIIDKSNIHSFNLPSAINEPINTVAGSKVVQEVRTAEFIIKCQELKLKLIEMSREIIKDESRQLSKSIIGESGWINHAQLMWNLAQQNASLWTFASVNEMLQRKHIEKHFASLLQKYVTEELHDKARKFIAGLANETFSIDNFDLFLNQQQKECTKQVEKSLDEAIGTYSGLSKIPSDVVFEYKGKLKKEIAKAVEEEKQTFLQVQQKQRLQNTINMKFEEIKKQIDHIKGQNFSQEEIERSFDICVQQQIKEIEQLHKGRSIHQKQYNIVQLYLSLNNFIKHPFAPEFVRKYYSIPEFSYTADEMNKQLQGDIVKEKNGQIKLPKWAHYCMADFKSLIQSAAESFCELEDMVYDFLLENMKRTENIESTDWANLIQNLCVLVDLKIVAPIYEKEDKVKAKLLNKINRIMRKSAYKETGFIQAVNNVMHTFACSMCYFFLEFRQHNEMKNEITALKEYCSSRKSEIILCVQLAKDAEGAANETVKLIFEKVQSHIVKMGLEELKEKMHIWMVQPEALQVEAMEKTFHSGNFDDTFAYIIKPMDFLKTLYISHFDKKLNAEKVMMERALSTMQYSLLQKLGLAAKCWFANLKSQENGEELCISCYDAIRALFAEFKDDKLSFLKEIESSVCRFLDNSSKKSIIKPTRFVQEICTQLTAEANFMNQKPVTLSVVQGSRHEMLEYSWGKSRGCDRRCPFCGHKCSAGIGHVKHSCDHHLLQAFNGWRNGKFRVKNENYNENYATLRICTDPINFTTHYRVPYSYKSAEEEATEDYNNIFLPFSENIRRFYAEWNIAPHNSDDIDESQKVAWLVLREKLCVHFNYRDKTPPEWEALYRKRANRNC